VSQRLIPALPSGRAAALEILLDTPRIRDLIKRGETDAIKDAMEQGVNEGCATFDSALFDLVMRGRIAVSEAIKASDSPNNLRIRIDRHRKSTGTPAAAEPQLRLVAPAKPR
jgi:twitching motility protein PilU